MLHRHRLGRGRHRSRGDYRDRDSADADLLEFLRERSQKRAASPVDRGTPQRGADRARRQCSREPQTTATIKMKRRERGDKCLGAGAHTTGRHRKNQIASTA